jgi:hypothetical protein
MTTVRLSRAVGSIVPCLVLGGLLFAALPAEAVLTLEGEVNPSPIEPGELFDFQMTVSSTAVTGSLTLRVLWPAALDFQNPVTTNGGDCPGTCDAGEFLTWNLGVLGPSTSLTVSFNMQVGSLADGTQIPFEIDLLEGGVLRIEKTYTIEVQSTSPLELVVDPLLDPVASGGRLAYELVYGNTAAGVSSDTELRFPVPAGTQFVSATGGGVLVGGEVVWDLGSLGSGSGGRQRVTLDVDNLAAASLLVVDAANLSGTISFQPRSAEATAVSRVAADPLFFEAEISPDPVASGELIDSQISIGNAGLGASGSLSVRMLWPDELDFQNPVTTAGGDCPGTCDAGEYVLWSVGVLGPQTTLVLAMNEPIGTIASGTLVPFEIELIEDGFPARTVSRTLIARTDSPLELAVDPRSDPAPAGAPLAYELVYGNVGSAAAENALLTFPVPAGTSFVSATGGGLHSGGRVTWDLGSLAPNRGGSERVTVQVGSLAADTPLVVDAAELVADVNFLPQFARASAVSRVDSEPLELHAEVQPDPVAVGELIDVQISLANPGGSPTGSLDLRVLWPEELDFQNPVTTAGGDCPGTCDEGEYLFWSLGALGPGAALTVAFNEPIGSFTNGRLVPFEIELLEAGINSRTVSRTLIGQSDSPLELTIDPSNDPAPPSSSLVYQVTYGNTGAASVANAALTFPVPSGASFVSATGGGEHTGGLVTWEFGTLAPSSGGRVAVTVAVSALAVPDFLEVDMATLGGTVDSLPRRARASAVVRVASEPLQLEVELGPETVQAGDLVSGSMTVTNPTGSSTGQLSLRLLWPEELDFQNPTTTGGGDCPGTCDAGEYLFWTLGVLGPGQHIEVTFSEDLFFHPDGTLVPFEIELLEAGFPGQTASRTLLYHPFSDNDMDGSADVLDPDDDNDGMPDWWEIEHGLDPFDPSDADDDPDGDGVDNLGEYLAGSDPNVFDIIFYDGFESGDTSAW